MRYGGNRVGGETKIENAFEELLQPTLIDLRGRRQIGRAISSRLLILLLAASVAMTSKATSETEASVQAQKLSTEGWQERLISEDLLVRVSTLNALASSGQDASVAEKSVADLLTESAEGKILSKWCYYALTKISKNPTRYLDKYIAAAGWLHYTIVNVGEVGNLDGPKPDMIGPVIPPELREASNAAWGTAIDAVIGLMLTSDGNTQERIADCLRKMGAPEDLIVPRIAKVLLDNKLSSVNRMTAATLIGHYGHSYPQAMKPLLVGLKDSDPGIRRCSAEAIGKLSFPYNFYGTCYPPATHPQAREAAVALSVALKDPEAKVRESAAYALGTMGHQAGSAVGALVQMVRDEPNAEAQQSAEYALGIIAWALRDYDPASLPEATGKAVPVLRELVRSWLDNKTAGPNTPVELSESADFCVLRAAESLGRFGDKAAAAVPDLHRVLKSTQAYESLKMTAIQSLGQIGPASAETVAEIVGCASYKRCQLVIAVALGNIRKGGADVERALIELTKAQKSWVRREAAKSLGIVAENSENVIKALESLLKDAEEDVRLEAKKAIHECKARGGEELDF